MALKDMIPFGKKEVPANNREGDNPFVQLHRRMNRLFDDLFKGFDVGPEGFGEHLGETFMPRVDIAETDNDITVSAELPGMDEKDIEVSMTDTTLTIKGEKKEDKEEKKGGYHRSERSYGSFTRSIPLPYEIDQNKVNARFKKGVLTIALPKSAQALRESKKISVKTE